MLPRPLRAACVALSLAAASCARPTAPGLPPRHVLLVTLEGVRADHLSAYQYARPTSAWTVDGGQRELGRAVAIDDLAADGVLFANAFSPAESTLTALKALLVGTPPAFGEVVTGLGDEVETLAERFREAGYTTAAFVSGETLGGAGGFDQGFDEYRHRAHDGESLPMAVRWLFEHDLGTGKPLFLWIHLSGAAPPFEPGVTPPLPGPEADGLDYVRLHFEAARAQDQQRGFEEAFDAEPWHVTARDFATLFHDAERTGDARWPACGTDYRALGEPPAPGERRHLIDLYDGDVAELSSRLRSFLLAYQSALEIDDAFADTLVAVCGVDGVALGERERWGRSLYAENVRVPLLFFHPNSILGRRVSDTVVDLVDVGPTLFDWTGAGSPAAVSGRGAGRRGRSLAPLLEPADGGGLRSRPAVSIGDGGRQAASLRTREWTLVWRNEGGGERAQLFDRVQDPEERVDVSGEHPAVVKRLRDTLVGLLTEGDA